MAGFFSSFVARRAARQTRASASRSSLSGTAAAASGFGAAIETAPRFPLRTNVEFVTVDSRARLRQRHRAAGFEDNTQSFEGLDHRAPCIIVGDREAGSGQVALRLRSEGDQGSLPLETFLERAREAVESRSLEP